MRIQHAIESAASERAPYPVRCQPKAHTTRTHLNAALGLAITLDWGMVDRYLDKEIHTIDPDSGNSTGSTADGELVAEDAEPHYSVGETIVRHPFALLQRLQPNRAS